MPFFASLFHSVSAFNNAGFSTFSDNLMGFRGNVWVNLVICLLIILGGLGFYVIYELILYKRGEIRRKRKPTRIRNKEDKNTSFVCVEILLISPLFVEY